MNQFRTGSYGKIFRAGVAPIAEHEERDHHGQKRGGLPTGDLQDSIWFDSDKLQGFSGSIAKIFGGFDEEMAGLLEESEDDQIAFDVFLDEELEALKNTSG